jgi:dipeptidyl aminopeptidase/acylaminoacyl peptidase
MTEKRVAPYGSWKSPITSELIVRGSVGLGMTATDGREVYWLESRPSEAGRSVVVRRGLGDANVDVNPQPYGARTRVHEYGGGDFAAHAGTIYFSNFADQRLYKVSPAGGDPRPLTPEGRDLRYADAVYDPRRNLLFAVREDHMAGGHEPANTIVRLDAGADERGLDEGTVVASGYDFYSTPRLSPDGRRLAWLSWNHPNMPWDGTELWVGELDDAGSIKNGSRVAGGEDESIFQPEWSPDGRLYFVSDRSGWWNLYRAGGGGRGVEAVCEREAEFGQPQWGFGMATYAFASAGRLVCAYSERGLWRLAEIDTRTGAFREIETPYTDISHVRASAETGRVVFRGGASTIPASIVSLDPATGEAEALRRSNDLEIDEGYFSTGEPVEFPTENDLTAHGFYYAPRNRDYSAPENELPPLLVLSHGGPTSAAATALSLKVQYWTSRGFAVFDVNYGGSTGYGRAYRRRLDGAWGVVDVDDCVNAARHLVSRGLADPARLAIAGGSAGGYTTLCALTFRDQFRAGASHYGVSDLGALVRDTHKFESRYLDRLVGPYPEREDIYRERSPINFTDRLSCPVIFFQGLEDKVVPPNQAEVMVEALRRKGLPVAYVAFEGEQHGFRRAENIRRALDGELYFYARVFGFDLAEEIGPVPIENL